MSDYKIELGVSLNTSDLKDDVKALGNKYKLDLGINLNDGELKNIKKQLTSLTDNTHRIRVDIDNSRLLKQIEHAKKELKGLNNTKGNQPSLNINTKSLEDSMDRVANAIDEIRRSLGSIDDTSGIKSLVTSVNQIATALGKAENESDSLIKSLSALSKKDFSVNVGLNMGKNSVANSADYGDFVRENIIPQFETQAKQIDKFIQEQYAKIGKRLGSKAGDYNGSAIGQLMIDAFGYNSYDEYTNKFKGMYDKSNMSNQLTGWKNYFGLIEDAAKKMGINLSSVMDGFYADKYIQEAREIRSGTKEATDQMQTLKTLFGSGINADNLNIQLDSIVTNLNEIKTALQGLSSKNPVDGLTSSFDRLSGSIEKLLTNAEKVKGVLGNGLSNTNPNTGVKTTDIIPDSGEAVQSAQQVGKKIGDTIEQSARQSIDLDDVIDSEVLDLMQTFSIAGDKGSKAFNEIRQALIECRSELQKLKNSDVGIDAEVFDTSRAFDKVSDAIANQMRAVNSIGDEYIKLAKYMTSFNDPKKGNKVRVPDFIKQEQGDDYKSSRGTLGIAFNTEKGISFASFIEDINDVNNGLGVTIDLTKGEEKAYEELVDKVRLGREQLKAREKSQSSLQASASTDDILAQNFINKNEIRDVAESSIDYINATEAANKAFAQASTQATNIVAQNEEKKQQAYKETADAIQNISKKTSLVRDEVGFKKSFDSQNQSAKEAQQYFQALLAEEKAVVSVKESFDNSVGGESLKSFTVDIQRATGEVERLHYAMSEVEDDSRFLYQGGSVSDKSIEKQTEARIKSVNKLQTQLEEIKASYKDMGNAKPIKDSDHQTALDKQYRRVEKAIDDVRNADNSMSASVISNAEKQKSVLESMVKTYRNQETLATSLRSKNIETVGATYDADLDKLVSDMRKDGVYTSGFEKGAKNLKSMLSDAVANKDKDAIVSFLNGLDKLEAGYKRAKASKNEFNASEKVGNNVSKLKSDIEILQQASPSIKNFKAEINGAEVSIESLLKDLDKVSTQGDFKVVEGRLEAFEKAAEASGIDLNEAKNKAKEVNDAYSKIYDTRKKIGSLEVNLIGAEAKGDARAVKDINDEITRLKANLSTLEQGNIGESFTSEQKANLKELRKQIQYNKKQAQNKVSADSDKAEAREVNDAFKEIYNTKKKIGSLKVDLIGAEAKKDAKSVKDINDEITRLEGNISSLDKDSVYSSRFTDEQKADLKELNELIEYSKKEAQNKVDYKLDLDNARKEVKEVNDDFKELKRLATEMGKIDIELAGLTDVDKDADKFNSLKRVAEELEVEFEVLYEKIGKKLNTNQVKELDQIFANTTGAVRELNNEMAKSDEQKELSSGLERLKSIAKEINSLQIDIFKSEDTGNIEKATNKIEELKAEATELRTTLQQKFGITSFDEIDDIARKGEEALNSLIAKAQEAKLKLAEGIKADIDLGNYANKMDAMEASFNQLYGASEKLQNSYNETKVAYREMINASETSTGDEVADRERLIQAQERYIDSLQRTNNLIKQRARIDSAEEAKDRLAQSHKSLESDMVNWLKNNSKAAKEYGETIENLIDSLNRLAKADNLKQFDVNSASRTFKNITKDAETRGLTGLKAWDRLVSKVKEYSVYVSAAEIFMYAEQALRDMFEQVKLIDSAMTELKKVTDETDASYNNFLKNAGSRAKELGTTIDGLVSSTADFARLGYDFKDAQGLAEVANIYAVVGDDIEGVEGATESLISTMAAFKDSAKGMSNSDFAMSIIDRFNEIGNKFSISSGGIGEALERSASSLMAANNTIDESIALITASNQVVVCATQT